MQRKGETAERPPHRGKLHHPQVGTRSLTGAYIRPERPVCLAFGYYLFHSRQVSPDAFHQLIPECRIPDVHIFRENQPWQAAPTLHFIDVADHDQPQLFLRRYRFTGKQRRVIHKQCADLVYDCREDGLLVVEMPVEVGLRHTEPFGEPCRCQTAHAHLSDDGDCHADYLGLPGLCIFFCHVRPVMLVSTNTIDSNDQVVKFF